jgi:DeoR/GlpR family transcriptional regulator of sugar metabolism
VVADLNYESAQKVTAGLTDAIAVKADVCDERQVGEMVRSAFTGNRGSGQSFHPGAGAIYPKAGGDGMLDVERRNRIISILQDKKEILVQETADMFRVTGETIRRDLKKLEKQGLLVRTHGGAVLPDDSMLEIPFKIREGVNIPGKNAIGRLAAGLINNGDTIFLDASTSSLYVSKHVREKKNLTVITNAERIIMELADCPDITLISTGGVLRNKSLSCVGRMAEKAIEGYHADKVFFSCKGFSPRRGMTDSNEQESEIRKIMLKCSETAVFLCDSTKFDKTGFAKTAGLEDIDVIITDAPMPEDWASTLAAAGVRVEIAVRT